MIKFNKYHVINTKTKQKARIHYNHSKELRLLGKPPRKINHVTIYEKDFEWNLKKVFPQEYANNSEGFVSGKQLSIVILEGSPLYTAARAQVQIT